MKEEDEKGEERLRMKDIKIMRKKVRNLEKGKKIKR
jgi:hypothetical protein